MHVIGLSTMSQSTFLGLRAMVIIDIHLVHKEINLVERIHKTTNK